MGDIRPAWHGTHGTARTIPHGRRARASRVPCTHAHGIEHKGIAMHHHHLAPFVGQRYLNLESYKRDGTPVQTPVWFAEDHGVLYVSTLANAGKVKRIRRNPRIRIAPCTMRGTVVGPWVEAEATIVDAM